MVKGRKDYKKPSIKESVALKRYLAIMNRAAHFFETYFRNRVVYYGTELETIAIYFSATNFMHLCGVKYEKGAASFFDDCLNHHLVLEDMMIKRDGTTFQKLQVLASIDKLIGSHVYLTQAGRYLYLEFDYALRTKKQILALTLKDTSLKIVPQSLLDLKRQKSFPTGVPVQCIYAKTFHSDKVEVYYLEENSSLSDFRD